ncbi:hypothetical protein BpHYR1_009546 [Brachionus plicatilis]|uniref:Uncharacterized protein n=1 Tax=Brachionus plicatilis TaxID=10195 RepID=A0A3M7Q3H6_BRAPC|nr:hypothetical protein BpHYR1_009546 [Brachionus plicatilis]
MFLEGRKIQSSGLTKRSTKKVRNVIILLNLYAKSRNYSDSIKDSLEHFNHKLQLAVISSEEYINSFEFFVISKFN